MCLLITIERYLVVDKPIMAKIWFSAYRNKLYALVLCSFATTWNMLRWLALRYEENHTTDLTYLPGNEQFGGIIMFTEFGKWKHQYLREIVFLLDIGIPLTVLIILNILTFRKIRERNLKINDLHAGPNMEEISTANMFAFTILALVASHMVPCCIWLTDRTAVWKEFLLMGIAAAAFNASINFVIYCAFGKSFRNRLLEVIGFDYLRKLLSSV